MPGESNKKVIRFFFNNKFVTGFFSFLYTAAIVFFIILGLVIYLHNPEKVGIGGFLFTALPALILIVVALLIVGESGKWWLKPHWLWTAFKKIIVDIEERRVKFIIGFWPFLSGKDFYFDMIDSLELTSIAAGSFNNEERFGLEIKTRDNKKWTFFTLFKDEREFREKTRELASLLDTTISDKTYGTPAVIRKIESSPLFEKKKQDYPLHDKTIKDAAEQKIPQGVIEGRKENGSLFFIISRRHEWLAFVLIFCILVGIYILTWVLDWADPKKPGGWEGLWLLFAGVLIFLFAATVIPVKRIIIDNRSLLYRQHFFGFPVTRKEVPLQAIIKVSRQASEHLTFRLIIVSDRKTIKVKNLNRDIALYLEERISCILTSKTQTFTPVSM